MGSWVVVSADKRHAIAARYQILNRPNPRYTQLKLRGLLPNQRYVVSGRQQPLYGDELMNAGVFIPSLLQTTMGVEASADFSAKLLVLDAVDD